MSKMSKMSTKLKVVEIFESVQGEVPLGKYALFIRLYGCNRRCVFCDTKYSWMSNTYFEIDVKSIHIPKTINYIVITGGEPLLQKDALEEFVKQLKSKNPHVKIALETNGDITNFNCNLFDLVVISPKDMYTLEYWLRRLQNHPNVILKVIDRPNDEQLFKYIFKLLRHKVISIEDLQKIYIMPFGSTQKQTDRNFRQILKRIQLYNLKGVNVTYRLHITLKIK